MPNIEKVTPAPGMYPEDLQSQDGESKNPWSMLEDLAHDKPAYTIDEDGDYHYKQADAMKHFSALAKEARKNGDTEKVEYYESFMRNTLKNDPISISREDFNRLSDDGKLNYFRMGKQQARIMGDENSLKQYTQEYDTLVKQLQNKPKITEQTQKSEVLENKSLNQRVEFHFPIEKAREMLASVMRKITPPMWDAVVYKTFTEQLPDDMEQKTPTGYFQFGLDFFKKQAPEYSGSPSSLKELFDSDEYKKIASPCITPQEKGGVVDEAMGFIHCFNPNKKDSFGGFGSPERIDGRFYLCPKPDNLVPIMNTFVQKNDEADLPYYFKFGLSPERNDKLVIYSSGEVAEKQLVILEEIQKEHPEWFKGSGKNPLWGDIEGLEGVYYGAQPKTNIESYGKKRADLFCKAMEEWRKENGIKWNNKTIRDEDISDDQVKSFKFIFAKVCRENGIEPKKFASTR